MSGTSAFAISRGCRCAANVALPLALPLALVGGLALAPQRPSGASAASAPLAAADTEYSALRRHVVEGRLAPLDAVRHAVLTHRLVLLGDVHPAAEPKALLLELLRDSAVAERLDALALEIPASAQRWVSAYLRSSPEDPSLLARDPAALRSLWGGRAQWLAIFHELYALQRARPRPLAVIAMDLPGWPARATSARAAVSLYGDRDSSMAAQLLAALDGCAGCAARGGPHVLAFLGGYHVLRGLEADLSIGTNTGRVIWLATRLERKGVHAYTVLADGLPTSVRLGGEVSHGATRLYDILSRRGWPAAPYAIDVDSTADAVRHAIREPSDSTGVSFTLRPSEYHLRDAVDLFLFLGETTPLDGARE